jgi:mediator of RNA polymerase II transcription subunit 14
MQDYTVSITCIDQLSPTGGSFELRFSRTRLGDGVSDDEDRYNPHECAEPFLRGVLRQGQGRLAPAMQHLVGLLRDTLPIVVELDAISRGKTEKGTQGGVGDVDTFAKTAGWYRVLYGDLR